MRIYLVHNLTSKTVILSDLRVEIGPRKVLDLEQVADRSSIESSRDLRQALNSKQLAITKYSAVRCDLQPKQIDEKQIHYIKRDSFSPDMLKSLIREVLNETKQPDFNETIKNAVKGGVDSLISSIRDQLASAGPIHNTSPVDETYIDPAKLAEISQKAVSKMSNDIETGGTNKQKKINILNRRTARDLADELE